MHENDTIVVIQKNLRVVDIEQGRNLSPITKPAWKTFRQFSKVTIHVRQQFLGPFVVNLKRCPIVARTRVRQIFTVFFEE